MSQISPNGRDPWYLRFHDLMPFRIREVLLVSSPYDAFILEEDGRLTERIFTEYSELNLSSAPRITHAATGARAMELLRERRFDLVITMVRLDDTDVNGFARAVKAEDPRIPVVVVTVTETELIGFREAIDNDVVDLVFLWSGDAHILLAILKQMEDRINADHDTLHAGVRVIVVVEDSVRDYSAFLSILYGELMNLSQSLIAEGINDLHKMMRMRARPKVVLARDYDEGLALYHRYKDHLMAVISDVHMPRGGRKDPDAGVALIKKIRKETKDLPMLLQSAARDVREVADRMGVAFFDKTAPDLLKQLRRFLTQSLGFGDFIFRLPDLSEVGRAKDVYQMEQALKSVPVESLQYHGSRHHFSMWFCARSMFRLAGALRPKTVEDFSSLEEMREHLIRVLKRARRQEREGAIADFAPATAEDDQFIRLGKGSVGGKARGIAFANSLLARHELMDHYQGMEVRIPRSVAVGTEYFDQFLEENPELEKLRRDPLDDPQRQVQRFCKGRLPEELIWELELACKEMTGPLAVRSSSLLEDSQFQPFAGIYDTFMLPNNHPSAKTRMVQLARAIKAVYASTFSPGARGYFASTPYRVEEEKMAVVVQEMVGQRYGERFYPCISGVALSTNYYPLEGQQPRDGIALVALGLGQTIVTGGTAFPFSPPAPGLQPQFATAESYLGTTQTQFFALDLTRPEVDFAAGTEASLSLFGLDTAEEDGTLAFVGSVYCDDNKIRDSLRLKGQRVVTFNNVLRWRAIPLAQALQRLLEIVRQGVGCPVEVEFAVDMGDWGRDTGPSWPRRPPCLYLLQVRPQVRQTTAAGVRLGTHPEADVLCRSDSALGHGQIDDLEDVVYVSRRSLSPDEAVAVAQELEAINATLLDAERPYLLIGPGRWGSADPSLGIPVNWGQISGARVIVETPLAGRPVEPSQGAHFFQNITSQRVGYLTIAPPAEGPGMVQPVDSEWLEHQPQVSRQADVCHVRLRSPLRIRLDGTEGRAVILKPS